MRADDVARNDRPITLNDVGTSRDVVQSGFTRRSFLMNIATTGIVLSLGTPAVSGQQAPGAAAGDSLEQAFVTPPDSSKVWAWWWWLDSAASKDGITTDLEAMKRQGISGVVIYDAGTGGPEAPKGPLFMSEEWRENFSHAVQEAARLGIEMSVNLCSGWNAGGPWVEREDACKALVWTETIVEGPSNFEGVLSQPELQEVVFSYGPMKPKLKEDWYRDIAVVACRVEHEGTWNTEQAVDLTSATNEGRLKWQVPQGRWTILRLGYTLSQAQVKNSSSDQHAWEVDPLSAQALEHHFEHTAAKLVEVAGPLAGKSLKYTQIDSWEIGQPTWTAKFIEEFRTRRGYDPTPYLPALANKKVNSLELTERFQWDYRRTLADLTAENYYGRLSKLSHARGLGTHSESGGPFYTQFINGLECEGTNDIPMAEFWCDRLPLTMVKLEQGVSARLFRSTNSAFPDCNFGSIRQAASAAHIYGKPICQAEAYTSFNDDWSEDPFFLKSYGDRAFCQGLTRTVLSFSVHQSDLNAKPGYQWEHVGTHFDRNITWWEKSHAWLTYLARCQHMLQQGLFIADVLYFAGETIPNFVLVDRKPVAGYNFDVIDAQALRTRATSRDGGIRLPDGMSYRYLVLPEEATDKMTPAVLEKIGQLVEGGITLVGSRPQAALGLADYPRLDERIKTLADAIWGADESTAGTRSVGKGRVIWGSSLEEVIKADNLPPDVELRGVPNHIQFDWIHRRSENADLYFLANGSEGVVEMDAIFRIAGKTPELWDAVTGRVRNLPDFREESGRTLVPMRFEAKQSYFVVFRKERFSRRGQTKPTNFPILKEISRIAGPWEVTFDPSCGGPGRVTFETLEDWTKRAEESIRYYSGTAKYRKTFDLAAAGKQKQIYLDLGQVKNVAQVWLNGRDLGVVWTAPWRVNIGDAVQEKGNRLEIEIVNLWPNRLIGDGKLPKEQRRTVTNVRTYEAVVSGDIQFTCPSCEERKKTGKAPELLPSGLLGPVTIVGQWGKRETGRQSPLES